MPLRLVLVLLLAACTSDDAPPRTVTDALPSPRAAGTFADACEQSAGWDRAMCTCAADLADAELSAPAHAFVVATLQDDQEEAEQLRGDLSFEDATQAGLFMVRAGRECGGASSALPGPSPDALAAR